MEIKRIAHRAEKRISVAFPYNQEMIGIIRSIEGAKWSRTLKAWHFPDNDNLLKGNHFKGNTNKQKNNKIKTKFKYLRTKG